MSERIYDIDELRQYIDPELWRRFNANPEKYALPMFEEWRFLTWMLNSGNIPTVRWSEPSDDDWGI